FLYGAADDFIRLVVHLQLSIQCQRYSGIDDELQDVLGALHLGTELTESPRRTLSLSGHIRRRKVQTKYATVPARLRPLRRESKPLDNQASDEKKALGTHAVHRQVPSYYGEMEKPG